MNGAEMTETAAGRAVEDTENDPGGNLLDGSQERVISRTHDVLEIVRDLLDGVEERLRVPNQGDRDIDGGRDEDDARIQGDHWPDDSDGFGFHTTCEGYSHTPLQSSFSELSFDCDPEASAPQRRSAATLSKKQAASVERLAIANRPNRRALLSEVIAEEETIRARFVGHRQSCRDRTRTVTQVLHEDAAAINERHEAARGLAENEAKAAASASSTADSKMVVLRRTRRRIAESINGPIDRATMTTAFYQLGILAPAASDESRKLTALIDRFWSTLMEDPDADTASGKASFAAFYRHVIIVLFPTLLPLLESPPPRPTLFEKMILQEASSVPSATIPSPPAFARPVSAAFFSVARGLIRHVITLRLTAPLKRDRNCASSSSNDDYDEDRFVYRPDVLPKSARMARRRCSGPQRFTQELQEEAKQAQRRRDAEEMRAFEREMDTCTFRPIVQPWPRWSSLKLATRDPVERFETLYRVGVHKVQRQRRGPSRSASPPDPGVMDDFVSMVLMYFVDSGRDGGSGSGFEQRTSGRGLARSS